MNKLIATLFAVSTLSLGSFAGGPSETNQFLAQARAATAKYHNVQVAQADGYVQASPCEPQMGYHYIKRSLIGANLTETQPQVLLYEDSPDSVDGKKLVGVEYFVPALTNITGTVTPWLDHQPPSNEPPLYGFINPNPALMLFAGQVFNGPMEGHAPGMPWHYDLHVYAWKHNPNGMFTTFNPTVNCY